MFCTRVSGQKLNFKTAEEGENKRKKKVRPQKNVFLAELRHLSPISQNTCQELKSYLGRLSEHTSLLTTEIPVLEAEKQHRRRPTACLFSSRVRLGATKRIIWLVVPRAEAAASFGVSR